MFAISPEGNDLIPPCWYAHSLAGRPRNQWERLEDHLRAVADRASAFASVFGCGGLAELAGWWHDLGKASNAFQAKLLMANGYEAHLEQKGSVARVDHSTAGAQHAEKTLPEPFGKQLAYIIAGHHAGLPDWNGESDSTLQRRLRKEVEPIDPPAGALAAFDPNKELTPIGWKWAPKDQLLQPFQLAFLTRMLFAALVDADWIETERFCDPAKAALRRTSGGDLAPLRDRLDQHLAHLTAGRAGNPAPVDSQRRAVLQRCRDMADGPRGWYSLTVPTGGGKTFSSLAFALNHAARHGLGRVIYALPYTSIIEQNAGEFRKALGDEAVLEHHSNLDPDEAKVNVAAELATENWDAPVIVTTNVQLFESLFAARKSSCRKLHNISRSVIVLDEAQALPPGLLRPSLAALDELVRNYCCTVVLCTATQPALKRREEFSIGPEPVYEIIEDPMELHQAMQRVRVEVIGKRGDEELVDRLRAHPAALCIVNSRRHAQELARRLADRADLVHLSAAMCPAHRKECIDRVHDRLARHEPCLVVSTQVVEAGVDLDFPVVYRALAGFDSIAQAAGRCNREGRLTQGRVFVFEADHRSTTEIESATHTAGELIDQYPDLLSPEAIEAYFRLHYWKRSHHNPRAPWDDPDVMACFTGLTNYQFREAAARFQWIKQQTHAVVVPWGEKGQRLCEVLRSDDPPDWRLLRQAQRYVVSVYDHQLHTLEQNTTVMLRHSRFWVLTNPEAYDHRFGLRMDVAGMNPLPLIF